MPTRPVILALSAAIVVVIASIWLLRPASTTGPVGPQPVLDLDAASITALEIVGDPSAAARIERTAIGWQLVGDDAPPWAIQEGRARAATRILADLTGRPADVEDLPPLAATLTIQDARGRTMSLGLREPVIGGRRVIDRIDDAGELERFAIDEPLYEVFVQTGLEAWRDPGLLGALPGSPARVELARGASRLELARIDGAWALRSPVATRASETSVDDLLSAIARLRVERFGEPAPPSLEATDPVTITIEADVLLPSDGEPVRTIERLVLTLYGAADTGGRLSLMAVSRQREPRRAGSQVEDLGATFVAVDIAPLQGVTLEPEAYVAPTALAGDPSLIAELSLNGRTYARTADAWAQGERAVPADQSAALSAIAALLTQTPTSTVELTTRPQPAGRASQPVVIRAKTITGDQLVPPEGLAMAVVEAAGGSGVLVIAENVTRHYTDAASLSAARAALVLARPEEDAEQTTPKPPQPAEEDQAR